MKNLQSDEGIKSRKIQQKRTVPETYHKLLTKWLYRNIDIVVFEEMTGSCEEKPEKNTHLENPGILMHQNK